MNHLVKSFFLLFILLCAQVDYAATISGIRTEPGNASSVINLTSFKVKDFELMTGKKMSWKEKIVFHFTKQALAHTSKTVDTDTLQKAVAAGNSDFNIGGFLLGFLLGLLGVLIAYLIGGNTPRWAWRGFGIWLIVLLIYLLAH